MGAGEAAGEVGGVGGMGGVDGMGGMGGVELFDRWKSRPPGARGEGGVYGHGAGMRRASRQAARHGGGDFCGICLRLRPGERRAEDEVKEEEEEDKDGECGRVWG